MLNERLELLRCDLLQAAIFSPDATTRMACDLALDAPSPRLLDDVVAIASCQYAPKLRASIAAFREEVKRG